MECIIYSDFLCNIVSCKILLKRLMQLNKNIRIEDQFKMQSIKTDFAKMHILLICNHGAMTMLTSRHSHSNSLPLIHLLRVYTPLCV